MIPGAQDLRQECWVSGGVSSLVLLQPCHQGSKGFNYREEQMLPNIFAPTIQCPAFPVVRISSLYLYFCSYHVRIRYNQVCYDGTVLGKKTVYCDLGRNQQLKATQHLFENNILDDSTGSKYNQKSLNDTDTLSYCFVNVLLNLCVCQVFRHYTGRKTRSTLVTHTVPNRGSEL